MYYIVVLGIAAALGVIPANIAKNKGYSFGLWWFYGWMLFIIAVIHVQFIPDKNAVQTGANFYAGNPQPAVSAYDKLERLAKLHEQGALDDEFAKMKSEILKGV